MKKSILLVILTALFIICSPKPQFDATLWDTSDAWTQHSKTRTRICLNGYWAFNPVVNPADTVLPSVFDGYFKIPGIWPKGKSSDHAMHYILKDGEISDLDFSKISRAWYQRKIQIPADWQGKHIDLDFYFIQSHVKIYIDENETGELFYPGGRFSLTEHITPGKIHHIAILLSAMPLSPTADKLENTPKTRGNQQLTRSGIPGDVYLECKPAHETINHVHVITSTRKNTIAMETIITNPGQIQYRLSAKILDGQQVVHEFTSDVFTKEEMTGNRFTFSADWPEPKLWDIHTPENRYKAVVSLLDENDNILDETLPISFGFREFWSEGRDFYLNGKKIHLRGFVARNNNSDADFAHLEACRKTCDQVAEYGFNLIYNKVYDFSPGSAGHLDALYQATDEKGMLVAFTLPHIKDFGTQLDDPLQQERFKERTEWLIRRFGNHPSIVFYTMNHNANGYSDDQNPLKIDGLFQPDKNPGLHWRKKRNRSQSLLTMDIVKSIDSTRFVYSHHSGHLGDMHSMNIYLNWAPRQERSDWLTHWATKGIKPLFFVEYGLPHIGSFSSYRDHIVWSRPALQCIWSSEFAAEYLGQQAYHMNFERINTMEIEEKLWAEGKPFQWQILVQYLWFDDNFQKIQKYFGDQNWRAFRTWGISAILPWDMQGVWYQKKHQPPAMMYPGDKAWEQNIRIPYKMKTWDNPERYKNLKSPGIVPDKMSTGMEWHPHYISENIYDTPAGTMFKCWNRSLMAWIGGKQKQFTEIGHNFFSGRNVEKQLIIVNDSRETVACQYTVTLLPDRFQHTETVSVQPGHQKRIPVKFNLQEKTIGTIDHAKSFTLHAEFKFDTGEVQTDTFKINVLPEPAPIQKHNILVYDPEGETSHALETAGIVFQSIKNLKAVPSDALLIIGKNALSGKQAKKHMTRLAKQNRVLICEQDAAALSRLGFRIQERGIRKAFIRTKAHPALKNLTEDHFHDWQGDATLLSPYLDLPKYANDWPQWNWCGFENTRVWRCGNTGSVSSVIIEKPAKGDFLPLLDCGFDLQYSPLLEHTDGNKKWIFCQLDISGRTAEEPAAVLVLNNLIDYLGTVEPEPSKDVFYVGNLDGEKLLNALGIDFKAYTDQPLNEHAVLVLGPKCALDQPVKPILKKGTDILCLGLDEKRLNALCPDISTKNQPVVPSLILSFDHPAVQGISNAELHLRTKPEISALKKVTETSNEIFRIVDEGQGRLILLQTAPWMFDFEIKPYLRTTYRRQVYLVSRVLNNLNVTCESPLTKILTQGSKNPESPWLNSYYLQEPVSWDDPYRYIRW